MREDDRKFLERWRSGSKQVIRIKRNGRELLFETDDPLRYLCTPITEFTWRGEDRMPPPSTPYDDDDRRRKKKKKKPAERWQSCGNTACGRMVNIFKPEGFTAFGPRHRGFCSRQCAEHSLIP